jgi:WD40 repeat protein
LLDTANAQTILTIPVKEKTALAYVSRFSPDGKYMLLEHQVFANAEDWQNYDFHLEVRETATGKKIAALAADKNVASSAYFSPDSQTLAVTTWQGKESQLRLFDIPENRVTKSFPFGKAAAGERLLVREPVFSPDGKRLAVITQSIPDTGGRDRDALDAEQPRIHLIDVRAGAIRQTLVAPQGFSSSLCFSADGNTLAVGSHGRVLLWDVTPSKK